MSQLKKTLTITNKNMTGMPFSVPKILNMIKNHKLAQALYDISIGKFNEILEYKAKWNGVNILRIGQFAPSSRMCTCGVVNKELKLSDRKWVCQSCVDEGLPLSAKQEAYPIGYAVSG